MVKSSLCGARGELPDPNHTACAVLIHLETVLQMDANTKMIMIF